MRNTSLRDAKNVIYPEIYQEVISVSKIDTILIKSVPRGFLITKLAVDILGALVGLVLALPFIIILSIIILVTTRGSVIYKHERVGRYGKPFNIYKFRSMKINAEDEGPQLSSRNDNRVTRVGRFMRRWRLDEIPNLFNVLKGEMSLVGPRPERKFFIDQIVKQAPEYSRLLNYKPGVTSLGEVEFGYAENVDEMIARMKFDLQYINNISIIRDIAILGRTIIVVLKGTGV